MNTNSDLHSRELSTPFAGKAPPTRMAARKLLPFLSAAVAIGTAGALFAQEPHYTSTANQGGSPGTTWASSIIWKLNGAGTAVAATAGNTYEATNNGTLLGNGTATTLLRNPYSTGVASIATFPGDSFIVDTNTQIRFKFLSNAGTSPQGLNFAVPTNSFPGANGLPGLVLNGGAINVGDSAEADTILGTISANPGTLSYMMPSDTLAGDLVARGFIIGAQLSGSGGIAILNAESTVPQQIVGPSNTFTGSWIVKAGWLQGAGDGTQDGYNSLGTNAACAITCDPQWTPPATFSASAPPVFVNGPSVVDFGSSIANCAGALILTNSGQLYLHGIVALRSVTVEGTVLTNGTYYYSNLASTFANNFTGPAATFASPGGVLVVQPYGPLLIAPSFATQPLPEEVYPGINVSFSATATGSPQPFSYHWNRNGAPMTDGGNVSGSLTATLTLASVSTSDAAVYTLTVSNSAGVATSSPASLTIVTQSTDLVEATVISNGPVAFYTLNETGDPATNTAAFDIAGGYTGTYGTFVQNGNPNYNIAGPRPANGFTGFATTNLAAQFAPAANSRITLPPFNLGSNNNNMTITCWINPNGTQNTGAGVVFCRAGTTISGINYYTNANAGGSVPLGYHWNNAGATYGWNSGIIPPANQWSFVSLVITPNNATLYVLNTNVFLDAVNVFTNPPQAFDGVTLIGADSLDNNSGANGFGGSIDNVAIFTNALDENQIVNLYTAAAGTNVNFKPSVIATPVSTNVYLGMTFQLSVQGAGPLVTYQWAAGVTGSGTFTNLIDAGNISGSATPTLTISNVSSLNALDYIVSVSNFAGITYSFPPATVTTMATFPAEQVTLSVAEAAGTDWNTASEWSDSNPAWLSAAEFPGTTYEVLPAAILRTPIAQTAAFPGISLQLDGNGIYTNINGAVAGAPVALLRFKPSTNPGTNYFPKLIMAGGELDGGNATDMYVIQGTMDVISNAPIGVNSGGNTAEPFRIDAYLTGNGSIIYSDFTNNNYSTGGLNITGTTNTFTGTWDVLQGALLGSGTNSLGTNNITINPGGALETLYNINSPHANLTLLSGNDTTGFTNGIMLLHQADTFSNVFINGTALNAGTYSLAQLRSNFPANFPTNWIAITGSTVSNTTSGSITVLNTLPVVIVQPVSQTLYYVQNLVLTVVASGVNDSYQWKAGTTGSGGPYTNLVNGGQISGATNATLTIFNVTNVNALDYICVITSSSGSVTSSVATLTTEPTLGGAQQVTMSIQQPTTDDWTTAGDWSDGISPSLSALEYPGSTYEILPGARLRSPVVQTATFPGNLLTIDGNGVFVNNPGAGTPQGELRFKQSTNPGTNFFPRLVLNGGQMDIGTDGLMVVQGEVDIISNSIIYVDNAGSENRPYRIDAYLTGNSSASIEYQNYDTSLAPGVLNIAGNTNAYNGVWNIVQGALLGSGSNSLGTNNINIFPGAALETLYNINSPQGTLSLSNGYMFLHQNDTFSNLFVNGTIVAGGTYTLAQLNAAYPVNFPTNWTAITGTGLNGSTFSSSTNGSITVLNTNPFPVSLSSQLPGQIDIAPGVSVTYSAVATFGTLPISYQWYLNGAAVSGATNSTFTVTGSSASNSVYVTIKNPAGTLTNGPSQLLASGTAPVVTLSNANWSLQGAGVTPTLSNGLLTLTDGNGNEAASAFYKYPQSIGGFNASFTYTPGGLVAADGVTLCVQDSSAGATALGANGGNLGYAGISNSAALELNIYTSATGGIGMAFGTNGQAPPAYGSVLPVILAGGDPILVQVSYSNPNMAITMTDTVLSNVFTTNISVGDLTAAVGGGVGFVGFTGGTGGSTAIQQISNFSYSYVVTSLPAVLSITSPSAGTYTISWPSGVLSTLHLQSSPTVVGPWANVTATPTLANGQYQVSTSPGASAQFYRLISP